MILDNLFAKRETQERRGGWEVVLEAMQGAKESATEINVTPETSLRMTAVFAAVSLLSETIGSLPLIVYERQGKSRRKATEHYLYPILHDSPNPMMTAVEFRSTLQGYLMLRGNAIAQIEYGDGGRVRELWPLRFENVHEIKIDRPNGRILYYYLNPDNQFQWLSSDIVWHLRGWGSDGIIGYNPISLARRAIGLGLAAEEFGARFFGNDARPGIVLEHPGHVGDDAQKHLKESWDESHKGLSKSHRVAILEEGMKLHEVGIPPEDAQFLETRKFQVTEIARLFRVPPHMIADLDRATFTNIEHQGIEFVTYSLQSWMARWEQSIKHQLMLPGERERYYAEHLVDSLLRGDTSTRYQAYTAGINAGWFTRADAREKENLEPIEGLEEPLVPMNMIPVGQEAGDEGEGDQDQARAENREPRGVASREERAKKQAGGRFRLARRQQVVFEDVARRIIRRERNDVGSTARKILGKEPVMEFERWLKKFYREHETWSTEQMSPSMQAYGAMVADRVADELDQDNLDGRTDAFVAAYAEEFGKRESTRSLTRLQDKIAKRGAMTDEELLAEIEEELDGWVDGRPANIGKEESVRENNAVALALYAQMGVEKIMSVATGESDCPYCEDLDGQVIGINQFFLKTGQEFQPEGAQGPLTVGNDMRHAPYHDGCDCMTVSA